MKNLVFSILSFIMSILSIFSIRWLAVVLFGDLETACAAIGGSLTFGYGLSFALLFFSSFYFIKLSFDFFFDYISFRKSRPSA